jgi:hypothetical protein
LLNEGTIRGLAFALHANARSLLALTSRGCQEYTGQVTIGHVWEKLTPTISEIAGAIATDLLSIRKFKALLAGAKLPMRDLAKCGFE